MSAPANVRDVRDVVRDDVRAQSQSAVGACGMCGSFRAFAGARVSEVAYRYISLASSARMSGRTSRTSRTSLVRQEFRVFSIPHTAPHIPHMLARARFLTPCLTQKKMEEEGCRNG